MLAGCPVYEERGKGPTLILVPGLDGTALLFYRQIPLLTRKFHVITFPLPDDSGCSMDSLVQDLKQLIEEVTEPDGCRRALLCGESFGGALSMSFALSHPELLLGLIIINSFPVIRRRLHLLFAPVLLRAMPWGAMQFVRRFTESRLHSPHTLPRDLAEFRTRMQSVGKNGYIRRLEILQQYDIRAQLNRIQTPTLLLAGDLDRLVPSVEAARFMAARMPDATLQVLRGYGHICLINHDFSLLDHVLPWFQTLPPCSAPCMG